MEQRDLSAELIILRDEPHATGAAIGTPAPHGDEREAREGDRVEQAGAGHLGPERRGAGWPERRGRRVAAAPPREGGGEGTWGDLGRGWLQDRSRRSLGRGEGVPRPRAAWSVTISRWTTGPAGDRPPGLDGMRP